MSDIILIVDDEEEFRDVVAALLELNGFEVIEAANVDEMYQKLDENNISLILLDIGLPENDGLSTLKELRPENDIPIVLLTGKGDINYKVVGLELGADDYITKPFHSHELVARLKNIIRRTNNKPEAVLDNSNIIQDLITFHGWALNTRTHTLTNPDEVNIPITGHEFAILQALINSAGRTLSREQLLDRVGNSRQHDPFDRSLDVMVAKLRRKLGDNAKMPHLIRTIRQVGYMFIGKID